MILADAKLAKTHEREAYSRCADEVISARRSLENELAKVERALEAARCAIKDSK